MIDLCWEYLSVQCIWLNVIIISHVHFQSESTPYSCLNVEELLARNRCDIWILIESSRIWTQNHLFCKWTLNHLAKLAKWSSCVMSTYLYGVYDCMLLSCHVTHFRVNLQSKTMVGDLNPLLSLKLNLVWNFQGESGKIKSSMGVIKKVCSQHPPVCFFRE